MLYIPLPYGKVCKICGHWYPASELRKQRRPSGYVCYMATCIYCTRIRAIKRATEWNQRHPERRKEILKRSYYKDPKRYGLTQQRRFAKKRNLPNTFTDADWSFALKYWHDSCAVCGRPQGLWHKLAMDHWIPLTDPSPDNPGTTPQNIVPLCQGANGCNNSKADHNPYEWLLKKYGRRKAMRIRKAVERYFEIVTHDHRP